MVCPRRSQHAQPATAAGGRARQTQPLDTRTTHPRSDRRHEPVASRLERLFPLSAQQPCDGQAQLAGARPGEAVVMAQTRKETGALERLSRRTAKGAVWPLVSAGIRCVETSVNSRPECLAMKRPGKPDTGNPFVRFDEG